VFFLILLVSIHILLLLLEEGGCQKKHEGKNEASSSASSWTWASLPMEIPWKMNDDNNNCLWRIWLWNAIKKVFGALATNLTAQRHNYFQMEHKDLIRNWIQERRGIIIADHLVTSLGRQTSQCIPAFNLFGREIYLSYCSFHLIFFIVEETRRKMPLQWLYCIFRRMCRFSASSVRFERLRIKRIETEIYSLVFILLFLLERDWIVKQWRMTRKHCVFESVCTLFVVVSAHVSWRGFNETDTLLQRVTVWLLVTFN
jgi:hypothetical protein